MTIRITRPEVEELINQRLRSGAFRSAEDVILQALRSSPPTTPLPDARSAKDAVAGSQSGFRPQPIYRTTSGPVNGYLLDTNVPSEFSRDRPEPRLSMRVE